VRDKRNVGGAVRGYKEINLRAMKLLKPGGVLVTCSCSQNFTPEMFEATLLEASRDTRRELQVLERRGAAPDHPVLLTFPESDYLQCWILRVL
jgi:23S rRNA (cytosine1962-C5)-methyltransferase